MAETLVNLIRLGWGRDNAAFRHVFTNQFIPGGTPAQHQWWNELERLTVSPENAARTQEAFHQVDVTDLASQLRVRRSCCMPAATPAFPLTKGARSRR